MSESELVAKIDEQGGKIRDLKKAKAAEDVIKAEVAVLLGLKADYKNLTGKDFAAPAQASTKPATQKEDPKAPIPSAENLAKKAAKKEEKKAKKEAYKSKDETQEPIPTETQPPSIKSTSSSQPNDLVKHATKNSNAAVKEEPIVAINLSELELFLHPNPNYLGNLMVLSVAETLNLKLQKGTKAPKVPYFPAIVFQPKNALTPTIIFGASAVSRFLAYNCASIPFSAAVDDILDLEEYIISPNLHILLDAAKSGSVKFPLNDSPYKDAEFVQYDEFSSILETMVVQQKASQTTTPPPATSTGSHFTDLSPTQAEAYDSLLKALTKLQQSYDLLASTPWLAQYIAPVVVEVNKLSPIPDQSLLSILQRSVSVSESNSSQNTSKVGNQDSVTAVTGADGEEKKGKKKQKKDKGGDAGSGSSDSHGVATSAAVYDFPEVHLDLDWNTTGLISSLRVIFTEAIRRAYPEAASMIITEPVAAPVPAATAEAVTDESSSDAPPPPAAKVVTLDIANISRCRNAAFGDFQCTNAITIANTLKKTDGYTGSCAPKDVAGRIAAALPKSTLIRSVNVAPSGYVNINISTETIIESIQAVVKHGAKPPSVPLKRVLVDFSSPNIAKEMHVGHLRSTIIGDAICRMMEFCGHDVLRVNHVGDWGTQFGMLISYLSDEYPDILQTRPNISDLNVIYKAAKKRFDEDEKFKERSRLNVVSLQSGDPGCRAIWTLLCDISRGEFQKVYDRLGVRLTEVGESFYNPFIPQTISDLESGGHLVVDEGMLIAKLENFTIPLILRKSDGGYGYDSTDMTALKYRINKLEREWIVYITDLGQANHFYMCFDLARKAGWVNSQELSHVGFGVVCGEDGKRFKSRSGETVRLVDLLDAAKTKLETQLRERAAEGKTPLKDHEIAEAAAAIGYGAVKYFDLRQTPSTNYIFSYDRMLDTRGDTAVYLLFSFARIASILRKAKDERGIDVSNLVGGAHRISIDHPAERALAFEILQFGDVIKTALSELAPNKLCEYLKELSVRATDFVTKCQVLNSSSEEQSSRLQLCEAVRAVMSTCFTLLGIQPLERI